ncbi:DUF5781 family protein [Halapricum hydrolyticum]|uniref:DUF5781 family protein n=1 Tax=Halapricum hydrolyticum TaxID=2979991 RepID=A0AAE3LEU1_9EURY|nr:DUF5781 family protein [Halapricum hydrolyticum]MCU4717659.1 DUF5781 family protein [Halapricum hydrolyticum]MCU4726812.1 DUF5781 family protein [Halapricum hydrolyticum]
MDIRVRGSGPAEPFLGAASLFETEHELQRPVHVEIRTDPDERTRVSHDDGAHQLIISKQAATSAMARELALHEFAHMYRHERRHPSHVQSTDEVLFLALAGQSVERRKITHCYQIANHVKDIYADDLWVGLAPGEKLVRFFESTLAAALADRPVDPAPAWTRRTSASDPDITAVNAAFALALSERHELLEAGHPLYDLAHAAARDAPNVSLEGFKHRFLTLDPDPDASAYRKSMVELTREYALDDRQAAD